MFPVRLDAVQDGRPRLDRLEDGPPGQHEVARHRRPRAARAGVVLSPIAPFFFLFFFFGDDGFALGDDVVSTINSVVKNLSDVGDSYCHYDVFLTRGHRHVEPSRAVLVHPDRVRDVSYW